MNFTESSRRLSRAIKKIVAISISSSIVVATAGNGKNFSVYASIPYSHYTSGGTRINAKIPESFLSQLGLKKILLIYENRIFAKGATNIDLSLLNETAVQARGHPNILVSLDVESWNRWSERSVEKYLFLVKSFKRENHVSSVGLYGVIPQTVFGIGRGFKNIYKGLNNRYMNLAELVDFFSPSLYNYSGNDFNAWEAIARFEISEARRLGNKPIIPYVTPEVWETGRTRFLSYEEMRERLELLKELGVDGCVVWGGSKGIAANATFDPSSGWAKAVVEFSAGQDQ